MHVGLCVLLLCKFAPSLFVCMIKWRARAREILFFYPSCSIFFRQYICFSFFFFLHFSSLFSSVQFVLRHNKKIIKRMMKAK